MARLTRREMKRDEVLETASRFFHYLTSHTRGLLLAILAVFVVIFVIVGIFAYLQGRSDRANALLARALSTFQAEIDAVNPAPDDPTNPTFANEEARDLRAQELFEQLESDFGGITVGRVASVYLGKLAARRGDTASAREAWESFLAAGDDHMLATEVRLNLLALDRSEGKAEEVVLELREAIAGSSEELPMDVALEQLAITLEQLGRTEEARDVYQRIVDEFPTSPYSSSAQQKLLAF